MMLSFTGAIAAIFASASGHAQPALSGESIYTDLQLRSFPSSLSARLETSCADTLSDLYTRQGGRVRALADRVTIDADDWYHSFLVISRGSRPVVIHQDEAKPSGYRASRLLTLRYVEGTGWVAEKSEGRVGGQRQTMTLSAADGTPKPASCE